MGDETIHVELAVMRVFSGGNARDGRYFYSFTPPIVDVTEPDTQIVYTLSKDTVPEMVLIDLYANDAGITLHSKRVGSDQRSLTVTNRNAVQQLVILSLLVMDGAVRVNCDPQMTNTPTRPKSAPG